MLLINLADPEWITIGCNEPVTADVICFFEKAEGKVNEAMNNKSTRVNEKSCVHKDKICHIFSWSDSTIQKKKPKRKLFGNITIFQFLFDAVGINFPPIELHPSSLVMTYSKIGSLYKYHTTSDGQMPSNCSKNTIHVYIQDCHSQFQEGGNLFKCKETYQSILFVHHCSDNKGHSQASSVCDLYFEQRKTSSLQINKTLKYSDLCVQMANNKTSPVHWESTMLSKRQPFQYEPIPMEDNIPDDESHNADQFLCDDGSVLPTVLMNDLVSDCGAEQEDETLLDSVLKGDIYCCPQNTQLPCREGFPVCYNVSNICSYQLNVFGKLIYCRTGEHLYNCKEFECNMMYKCPKHYCIPWSYVCEGKWDCPQGFEEQFCKTMPNCKNMYRCENSYTCIHLKDVCDGVQDCPLKEDESFCSLTGIICPNPCVCLMFAIHCCNMSKNTFNCLSLPHHVVVAKHIEMEPLQTLLHCIIFFSVLSIGNNSLENLCSIIPSTQRALLLDAGFNHIIALTSGCFGESGALTIIKLNNNNLSKVDNFAFSGLKSLAALDISFNKLSKLPGFLCGTSELKLLFLHGNNKELSQGNINEFTKLKYLKTDVYSTCCLMSSDVQCLTEKPWFFTCTDLLPGLGTKFGFYVESILTITFSCISVILRLQQWHKDTKQSWAFGSTVVSVNTVDITCGLYLTIIWVQDIMSEKIFAPNESKWRSSFLCFLAFSILLNFCLLSPVLLCFVSVERLMVVLHPMDTKFKKTNFTVRCVCVLSIITFVLSLGVTVLLKLASHQVPFKLCSPFIDPTHSVLLLRITTWVLFLLQVLSSVFIAVVYGKLLKAKQESTEALKGKMSNQQSNRAIILQLVLATMTNILCWIPSSIVYLIAMFLERFSMDMMIWTMIVATPLNSVINPVIFSIALRRTK